MITFTKGIEMKLGTGMIPFDSVDYIHETSTMKPIKLLNWGTIEEAVICHRYANNDEMEIK